MKQRRKSTRTLSCKGNKSDYKTIATDREMKNNNDEIQISAR